MDSATSSIFNKLKREKMKEIKPINIDKSVSHNNKKKNQAQQVVSK